jgi:hypothetical protein
MPRLTNNFDRLFRKGFDRLLSDAGEYRQIVIRLKAGQTVTRTVPVIWSTEAFKDQPILGADGGIYYKGDVLLSVKREDIGVKIKPDDFIECPPGAAYRVSDFSEEAGIYYITLVRHE